MEFPSLRAYMAAIKDKNNINVPFFKSNSMQIFLNKRGEPYMSVGGFGAVFRFKDKNDNQYALKVFTRDAHGRAERYKALHNTLQITKFPFMVDFQYVPDGVLIGKKSYPAVIMEWGKGIPINAAIFQDLEDDGILQNSKKFAGSLFSIVKVFQQWNMGHGDFQEGNLLIKDDNTVVLIDYDGMYVPSLDGKQANEIGLADYQHPNRKNAHFGSSIDDFALLSILYQLSIITPKLWEKYHDDKRLILRQADYKKPEDSLLMKEGLKSKDSHVKDLAALLTEACSLEPLKIRAIEKLESSKSIMDWIIPPIKTAPDQNYSSIIQKVVSLSEEDMSNFENNKISIVTSESEKSKEADKETKPRKDADGSWGFIGSLLFEEVDDEKTSNNDSDKGTIGKLKKTLFGLIFEDDDDENQQAPVANAPNNNLVQPEKDSSDKENSNKNQEKPPIVQTIKEEKEDKTKQDNSISSLKDKTAPLPDWLKKRKEKEF